MFIETNMRSSEVSSSRRLGLSLRSARHDETANDLKTQDFGVYELKGRKIDHDRTVVGEKER